MFVHPIVQQYTQNARGKNGHTDLEPQTPGLLLFSLRLAGGKGVQLVEKQNDHRKDGAKLNDHVEHGFEFLGGIELDKLEGKYTVTDNNQIIIQSKFGKEYIRFSITKKGKLVLIVLNDMNLPAEGERVMEKYDLDYNKGENNLIGTWKSLDDPNEKFIFNEDFTGKSVGLNSKGEAVEYKYYYSYKNNEVNIIIEYMIGYEEMVKTSNFKIQDNILTMYGENKEGKKIEIKFEREA